MTHTQQLYAEIARLHALLSTIEDMASPWPSEVRTLDAARELLGRIAIAAADETPAEETAA